MHHFNLTHVGFYCFLFLCKFTWTFSFTHVRALGECHPKEKFPTIPVCKYCPLFWPNQIHRAWTLPHHHHHHSSVLLAPSGLTSCTSQATPGKSRCHIQPICSLMPVPGSGRRLPLFLGASTLTNQNADDDDGNIHENIEAEGNWMRARWVLVHPRGQTLQFEPLTTPGSRSPSHTQYEPK